VRITRGVCEKGGDYGCKNVGVKERGLVNPWGKKQSGKGRSSNVSERRGPNWGLEGRKTPQVQVKEDTWSLLAPGIKR